MRDWTEWVRQRLPLDDLGAPEAREVVEELASQLADVYEAARARGLSEGEADAEARSHVEDWEALASSIRRARPSRRERAARDDRGPGPGAPGGVSGASGRREGSGEPAERAVEGENGEVIRNERRTGQSSQSTSSGAAIRGQSFR